MEFSTIVSLFENLEKTTKRGEKTLAISKILSDLQTDEIEPFFLLLQGRVFAEHDQQNLGISTQYIIKALERVSGYSKDEIVKKWSKVGDIGTVTVDILSLKKQSTLFEKTISLTKMMSQLRKLPTITGNGAIEQKTQIICDLLTSVDAKEAKYLVRIILEVMRVGIGEGIMRDAIVWAYFPRLDALSTIQDNKIIYSTAFDAGIEETADILKYRNILDSLQTKTITQFEEATLLSDLHCDVILTQSNYELCRKIYQYWTDSIQHAIDITNDIATIAKVTSLKDFAAIKQLKPVYGKPLKAMLAKKAVDIADGMQTVGMPCAIEYKYDGFRMQIHKNENKVTLFTRKLEEVTIQFPDVIASVLAQVKMERCILDAEVVGKDPKTQKFKPFQDISQRIRRKYDISQLQELVPVQICVFDIIQKDADVLIDLPFKERRAILEKHISPKKDSIELSSLKIASNADEINAFYQESLAAGNEGLMLKSLDSPYKPGSRVGFMMKLKPIMDTLDLVITQATWGEGKRASWLTSFVLACVDENGQLQEVGRVGTGFKELTSEDQLLSFEAMTQALEPLILERKGKDVFVKPQIILEIAYEEIQKSNSYSSGYALRFPRVVSLKDTRSVENATGIDVIEDYFFAQQKRT